MDLAIGLGYFGIALFLAPFFCRLVCEEIEDEAAPLGIFMSVAWPLVLIVLLGLWAERKWFGGK